MDNRLDQPSNHKHTFSASEQRFQALITATSDVIFSLSADWEIMHELDGRGFLLDTERPISGWKQINVYEADMDLVNASIAEAIKFKKIFALEHRVNRADGTIGWTFSRAVPIFNDNGEITEWFGTASDITARKNAELALLEAREKSEQQKRLYETITAGTPDLIYVFDLEYRFTYANKALLEMWGKSWEEAIGKGLLDNGYETWHAEMHEREIDHVVATGKPIRGEVSFPHATLGKRIYDYIFTPVFNAHGKVASVAGTTRDVTERKNIQEALQGTTEELQATNEEIAATNEELAASNEELIATNEQLQSLNEQLRQARQQIEEGEIALRLAIEAADFGTWFIHSKTREFITDTRLKQLFGYHAHEDLSIEQALAQVTDEYREMVSEKLENAIYNNGDYDVTYPVIGLHDNQLRWLRSIGNLKADPSGNFSAFTGVVMDITEQHLAAEKIARAEEDLRMAMESGGLATWRMDEKTGSLITSAKFKEIFGVEPDGLLSFKETIAHIHLDYQKHVNDSTMAAIKNGGNITLEYPLNRINDGKLRWVRSVGKLVQDKKNGNYITGVIADITEQKNDEIRKNDFIAMVSHELKTPLTSMKGFVQVVLRKLRAEGDQFAINAMEKANAQVEKMTAMVNGFLNISRLESGKISINPALFNLADLIRDAEEETQATISSHRVVFAPVESVLINAEQEKIGQVIHNLISNAVKYAPAGSTIHVACTNDGHDAYISVSDNGIGISEIDLAKIFDRYYRVEDIKMSAISGFGIGLYLCKEIISRHHGKIWAQSELGKGSTFSFSLPMAK